MTVDDAIARVQSSLDSIAAGKWPAEKNSAIVLAAMVLDQGGIFEIERLLEGARFCEKLFEEGLHQSVKTDRGTPCLK